MRWCACSGAPARARSSPRSGRTTRRALPTTAASAPARWRRGVWLAQLALIAGSTLLITLFLPEYWLHPYGPISKNLPVAAAIALLWALEPRRKEA